MVRAARDAHGQSQGRRLSRRSDQGYRRGSAVPHGPADLASARERVKSGSAPRYAEAPANQAFLGDWCNGNMGVSKTLARGSIPRSPVGGSGREAWKHPVRLAAGAQSSQLPPMIGAFACGDRGWTDTLPLSRFCPVRWVPIRVPIWTSRPARSLRWRTRYDDFICLVYSQCLSLMSSPRRRRRLPAQPARPRAR